MSENTQDKSPKTSSEKPSEEVQAIDKISSLANQPAEAEKPDPEAAPTDALTPQADQPAEVLPTPENALPPEAQGEANGGPLGCCLGTMIGLLLSLSLAIFSRAYASTLVSTLQGNYGLLGLIVRILMGILALAFAIFFGYAGWKLGKRFFREYEPSKRELQYNAKIAAKNAKRVKK